jgi:hypothetical protein
MNNLQYTLIILVLLIGIHNWLISSIEQINQQLITADKSLMPISFALFLGTVLLMLLLAPSLGEFFNGYGLLAISFSLVSSFLIIRFFFSSLLREIRYQTLWFKFFINPNLFLAIFFIIATELLVLYWLKEVDIYIQQTFLIFVSGYAMLIILSGFFLGFPKRQFDDWRLSIIVIIDPIIVVFFAVFLLQIVLSVFYKFI